MVEPIDTPREERERITFEQFKREMRNLIQEFQNDHKVKVDRISVGNINVSTVGEPNFQVNKIMYELTGY